MNDDLIDREALKAAYLAAHKGEPGGAYKLICEAPTIDIIRCCECERHDHDGGAGYCNRFWSWTMMSDFCSYGIREARV